MRFVDEVRVTVASGNGGHGCVSFLRAAGMARGGPDGGNGGRGGDLIIEATTQRNTLVDYRWNRAYRADNGVNGGSRHMTGASGDELVLYVPVGTQLHDVDRELLVADLSAPGDRFVLPGGRGGRGNRSFKSSTHRTPRFATDGKPGVELDLLMELKLIADVGLLGFPNAGKSTLISRVSAARPKVADYPFTTLVPNLGVVRLTEGSSFVIADIPGLIEGAAEGAGLGLQFLKHVERCGCYLHLLSMDPLEAEPPAVRFAALNAELKRYDPAVAQRPQLVVLTKTDLLDADEVERQRTELQAAVGTAVHTISSVRGDGLQDLMGATWKLLDEARDRDDTHVARARSRLVRWTRDDEDDDEDEALEAEFGEE